MDAQQHAEKQVQGKQHHHSSIDWHLGQSVYGQYENMLQPAAYSPAHVPGCSFLLVHIASAYHRCLDGDPWLHLPRPGAPVVAGAVARTRARVGAHAALQLLVVPGEPAGVLVALRPRERGRDAGARLAPRRIHAGRQARRRVLPHAQVAALRAGLADAAPCNQQSPVRRRVPLCASKFWTSPACPVLQPNARMSTSCAQAAPLRAGLFAAAQVVPS